jgi:DNA-binding LytR/AlgR family response regulator
MSVIRIGVVDDDPANRRDLLHHLSLYSEEHGVQFQVTEFGDGSELVDRYRPEYDILLLDVQMPQLDGLAAARQIREVDSDVIIIFVTNMAQYAIKGYEVDALSYLVKPVPYFAFAQEMGRSLARLKRQQGDSIVLTVGGTMTRVPISDIIYVESVKHRITVHTLNGQYSFSGTLKAMDQELGNRAFFRSNSCYIVNLQHVTRVEQQTCVMTGGDELQVSRPRRRAFLEALTDYVGGKASR